MPLAAGILLLTAMRATPWQGQTIKRSNVTVYDLATKTSSVVYTSDVMVEAPNWSPDGKYIAYSVSKRPFEDELFYMDIHTGKCWQMPVRTGSFGWDWVK